MKRKSTESMLKREEIKVEIEYSKNNIKIDDCLLNILKQKINQ